MPYNSPKIYTYDKDEKLVSENVFKDDEKGLCDFIRNSGKKYIQVGIGLEWDVLEGVKHKIKKLSDESLLDLILYGEKIDIFETGNYIFVWLHGEFKIFEDNYK